MLPYCATYCDDRDGMHRDKAVNAVWYSVACKGTETTATNDALLHTHCTNWFVPAAQLRPHP